MNCAVCNAPGQGQSVTAASMSAAVKAGFNPFKAGLMPGTIGAWEMFRTERDVQWPGPLGKADDGNWNVCDRCMAVLKAHLDQPPYPAPDDRPTDTTTSLSPGIAQYRLQNGYTLIDMAWMPRIIPDPVSPLHCAACAKEVTDETIGQAHCFSCRKRMVANMQAYTITCSVTAYLCKECASRGYPPTDFMQAAFDKGGHLLLQVGNAKLAELWREVLQVLCEKANGVLRKLEKAVGSLTIVHLDVKRLLPGRKDWRPPIMAAKGHGCLVVLVTIGCLIAVPVLHTLRLLGP